MTKKKYWQILPSLALVIFLIVIISPWASSQVENPWKSNLEETTEFFTVQASPQSEAESTPEIPEKQESIDEASSQEDAPVVLDGETLYTYSSAIKGIPAEYRAERTSKAIEKVAKDFAIPIDSLKIIKLEGLRVISTEEDIVIFLAEADARAANRLAD